MSDWPAVRVTRAEGQGDVVLVCEHASHAIPAELLDLGLAPDARHSHAAWDIGALDVATRLSEALDAPLVAGGVSRLVYDCNRPPEAPSAIPAVSEVHAIPGNAGLSPEAKADRAARLHDPFHASVVAVFRSRPGAALVTVHSFTPVFHGVRREVELGFLCHGDDRLARAALAHETDAGRYRAALNEPYAASDGVTYTLRRHGDDAGRPALMIEIRNDLIAAAPAAHTMADHLARTIRAALASLREAA